jgi:glutamate carboxypeptidase
MLAAIFQLAVFLSHPSLGNERVEALTDQITQLTNINSGTSNKIGVGQIQSWIGTKLKGLGFNVNVDEKLLLTGDRKGQGSNTVVFIVHADTIFESTSPFQKFEIFADRKTAQGPGVIDAKGGIVVAIEGLKRFLQEQKSPSFNIVFVSSPSEETGSVGLIETFRKLGDQAWMVLGFEPALENGSIIQSRKGNRWYKIEVFGKEAHAGRAHQDGINACHGLANVLTSISELTDYNKDVTLSIGRMEGGKDKYNIVCGTAVAKVDTRFQNFAMREDLDKKISGVLRRIRPVGLRTQTTIEDDCPPFSPSKSAKPYLQRYLALIQKIEGRKVVAEKSGGSADSNYFSKEGVVVIDGLGPVGGKMHTSEEFILLSSLETRAEALRLFLRGL